MCRRGWGVEGVVASDMRARLPRRWQGRVGVPRWRGDFGKRRWPASGGAARTLAAWMWTKLGGPARDPQPRLLHRHRRLWCTNARATPSLERHISVRVSGPREFGPLVGDPLIDPFRVPRAQLAPCLHEGSLPFRGQSRVAKRLAREGSSSGRVEKTTPWAAQSTCKQEGHAFNSV